MASGAVGFIGILVDNFASHHQYRNEAYRAYDPGMAMWMPALWVSPVEGAALVAQIGKAGHGAARDVMAELHLQGELSRQTGRGVYGILPGLSEETILVQSHHDSATTGAVEDASGAAEVLALARYFGQMPRSARPRTLMFATMDTHFTDYAVHKSFATQHLKAGNPSGRKVVAALTVEHVGREFIRGPDGEPKASGLVVPRGLMVSTEVAGFEALALETMRRFKLERTVAVSTSMLQRVGGHPGLPADSSDFLRAGVPVIALVGAPLYLYDEIDTTDKVARDELGKVARAFAYMVERIGKMPSAAFKRLEDTTDF
ncbi:MAG: M28 family peptidase [Aquabacterium sp.]